jgi:hypothetical protein
MSTRFAFFEQRWTLKSGQFCTLFCKLASMLAGGATRSQSRFIDLLLLNHV